MAELFGATRPENIETKKLQVHERFADGETVIVKGTSKSLSKKANKPFSTGWVRVMNSKIVSLQEFTNTAPSWTPPKPNGEDDEDRALH